MLIDADQTCEWSSIAPSIWSIVDLGQAYLWSVSDLSRQRLASLIPVDEFTAIFATDDLMLINRNLREMLAPHLLGQDQLRAAVVALWIVRDWGRVRRGPRQTIIDWSGALGAYGDMAVSSFVERQGASRISSWSKLLAFADHSSHAIYDSRTTVALNCALAQLQDNRRFIMPASQSVKIGAARQVLVQQKNTKARGYWDYLDLLRCFVTIGGPETLLAAEMALFANAPRVAAMFVGN